MVNHGRLELGLYYIYDENDMPPHDRTSVSDFLSALDANEAKAVAVVEEKKLGDRICDDSTITLFDRDGKQWKQAHYVYNCSFGMFRNTMQTYQSLLTILTKPQNGRRVCVFRDTVDQPSTEMVIIEVCDSKSSPLVNATLLCFDTYVQTSAVEDSLQTCRAADHPNAHTTHKDVILAQGNEEFAAFVQHITNQEALGKRIQALVDS